MAISWSYGNKYIFNDSFTEGSDPNTVDSVYGPEFDYVLSFTRTGSEGTETITNISASGPSYVNIVSSGNTIRLSTDSLFSDNQSYTYFLETYEYVTVNSVDSEQSGSIIEWVPPPIREITEFYSITITSVDIYGSSSSESITLKQTYHWYWEPSLTQFNEIVSRSIR